MLGAAVPSQPSYARITNVPQLRELAQVLLNQTRGMEEVTRAACCALNGVAPQEGICIYELHDDSIFATIGNYLQAVASILGETEIELRQTMGRLMDQGDTPRTNQEKS